MLELTQFDQIIELFIYMYNIFIFYFIEVVNKTESILQTIIKVIVLTNYSILFYSFQHL